MSLLRRITLKSIFWLALFGFASFKLGGCAIEARNAPYPGATVKEFAVPSNAAVFRDGFRVDSAFSTLKLEKRLKDVSIEEFFQLSRKSAASTAVFVGMESPSGVEVNYWLPAPDGSYTHAKVIWRAPWREYFVADHYAATQEPGTLTITMFPDRDSLWTMEAFLALCSAGIGIVAFIMSLKDKPTKK